MVITDAGRLVWIVDGYMTSEAHPYARDGSARTGQPFNYIRNSVKATVDAYDGNVHLYVFDQEDPLIRAYQQLFPDSVQPALGHAGRSARAHPLAGSAVPRAGGNVPHLSHARSGIVLQSRRPVGPGDFPQGKAASRQTGARRPIWC